MVKLQKALNSKWENALNKEMGRLLIYLIFSLSVVGCSNTVTCDPNTCGPEYVAKMKLINQQRKEEQLKLLNVGDPKTEYQSGISSGSNSLEGCLYLEKSAIKNFSDSFVPLSKCYDGGGFGQDPIKRRKWLKMASTSKDPKPLIDELSSNLHFTHSDATWLIQNNSDIYTKEDVARVQKEMASNKSYVQFFNVYEPKDVVFWLKLKSNAAIHHLTIGQELQGGEYQETIKIHSAEIQRQAEFVRQKNAQAKAKVEEERLAAESKAKIEEEEKSGWYKHGLFVDFNLCERSLGNPGEALVSAKKFVDQGAYVAKEEKEGGVIVRVIINLPSKGGSLDFLRGKGRCEDLVARLNASSKNADDALKNKYK